MNEFAFKIPDGINFRSEHDISIPQLLEAIRIIAGFLRELGPSHQLDRYDDWWEHDGLQFFRSPITIDQLLEIANTRKSLIEAMPGDDFVFVGIAPSDYAWYLRIYVDIEIVHANDSGRLDLTLPESLAEAFSNSVVSQAPCKFIKQDSHSYFKACRAATID
jgi:hypothetical protein